MNTAVIPGSPNTSAVASSLLGSAPTSLPGSLLNAGQRQAAVTQAAKSFESFFVTSMLESMYAGVKPDPLFGGGSGESMYRSLLNQQYGEVVADHDSFGIAEEVRAEMLRAQEKS